MSASLGGVVNDARSAVAISRDFFAPGWDRDDFRQEAIVAAWLAERTWRPELGPLSARVRLCVRARLTDIVRTATREKRSAVLVPLGEWNHPACDDGPAWPLTDALRALPARHRRFVVWHAAGFSYDEIAERDGCSVKAVDNCLYAARRRLAA